MKLSTTTHRKIHVTALVVWVLLVPPTLVWWSESTRWLIIMSIYAIIAGHWAAFEASGNGE